MKEVKGCGMRSSVGFLSRRKITGHPLMKEEFQRLRLAGCTSLYKKDMLGHFGCVNAIEFSNNGGEWLVSGGDDRRVLLWHMEKAIHSRSKPLKLKGEHLSNIFCLAFDSTNKRVFSGGNDEQVILHDVERGETLNVFLHDDAVYGLSVSPVNDNVFASSSDDGRVLIWDTREPPHGEPFCLANYPSAFHSVMFNPAEPRLLATANSKEGVGLWDIRKPRSSLLRYGGSLSLQSAMSVRFNSTGTQLLALRRRLPPVLYELHSRLPSFQFDNQGYFNSCTMKSCCFAGDRDQECVDVLTAPWSGSLEVQELSCLRFLPEGCEMRRVNMQKVEPGGSCSSHSVLGKLELTAVRSLKPEAGVEKVIKVWSPYQQPESVGDLEGRVEDKSRSLYTHEEYISLVLNSGSGLSHDYVSQSIQEDPRMMAFFDSLVRREIEGWSSDSDSDLSEGAILQLHARGRRSLRVSREGAATPAPLASASAGASGHHSDSDHSSSSSLAGPDGGNHPLEEGDGLSRRGMGQSYQSVRLLDLVNDSSDSSGFWPDPMPRPRSPSPRNNSSLSSPSSSPARSSSSTSSSSSSSSEGEDAERRRVSTRRRNAARRRRMHFPCRPGDRPESTQALYPAGSDPCGYPKITIDDPSSSSSSSSSVDEGRDSTKVRNQTSPQQKHREGDRLHCQTETPPGSSSAPSPDNMEGEVEVVGSTRSPPPSEDRLTERTHARGRDWDEGGSGAVAGNSDGAPVQSQTSQSSDVAWGGMGQQSPELNGQHHKDAKGKDPAQSSSASDEDAVKHRKPDSQEPADSKTPGQAQSPERCRIPGPTGGLKRTRVRSGEVTPESSPSEKKYKT
ncbi:hypothetical protein JZ751_003094 [Albula glossodonta]|uniref:DDB1- and CUL4-associated factor 5 n=1 Tax=Albula glossodonta TaxID=121402 RepID=A0A8T2NA13_9TELE|nr:hypothetical protein JZ751_003094 [Albula glossodonta]